MNVNAASGGGSGRGGDSGAGALLTVQTFRPLGKGVRAAVAEEGARLLAGMTSATSYDVRFGDFAAQG